MYEEKFKEAKELIEKASEINEGILNDISNKYKDATDIPMEETETYLRSGALYIMLNAIKEEIF